jgi:uncharacterized protein YutE (UPF0331/DUF86 family)
MWNSLGKSDKQLQIKEKFFDKYTLYQHSLITMGSLVIDTKNECRWDVKVLNVDDNYYNIEVLTLDNVITETNNSNIRDISLLNNTFKKMYNELNLLVNHQGRLIKVLNLDVIKQKWQKVKAEMVSIQANHPSIDGLIALNDATFATDENIVEAVKNNEFFEIFFHCFFGTAIPGSVSQDKKSLFMQAEVDWKYTLEAQPALPSTSKITNITITGTPYQVFNNAWLTKAYGSFPITTATELKPSFNETANYAIETQSGKVLKATLKKEEIAHPQLLFARIAYELVADGYSKEPQPQPNPVTTTNTVNTPTQNTGKSIILD